MTATLRLLYLVPKAVFDRKMSRVRFHQVEAIGEHAPVHTSGPGWPDWRMDRSPVDNVAALRVQEARPELVLAYQVRGLAGSPVPVVLSYNEAFDTTRVDEEVRDAGAALVIFHHENDMKRYGFWGDRVHRAHVPHAANANIYHDYGLPKDIDVLVCGNMSEHYYPFRRRLAELAWRELRKRAYTVVWLPHPGYTLTAEGQPKPGTVVGPAFAQFLNRSKLVVTCSMRFKYALAKYSEITNCRALPVADVPDERQEYFEDTTLVVHPWERDAVILARMEEMLDDAERLKKATDHAWDEARKTSTMGRYAERFLAVVATTARVGAPEATT